MGITSLAPYAIPRRKPALFAPKPEAGLPLWGVAIEDFDTWQEGYAGATVIVLQAGTTRKARLFADPGLAIEIENPQTLLRWEDERGRSYGKWATPVYTIGPYWLQINDTDQTSVRRPPLFGLAGSDASLALVKSSRGRIARTLRDWLDDDVRARSFGALGESPAENTATLAAAIGAAAAVGGGDVLLPAGSFEFLAITLPSRVRLVGQGRGVTVLRSMQAEPVVTVGGVGAGLKNLTLDGVNLVPASVGVAATQLVEFSIENVEIRRFDIGMRLRGGQHNRWSSLFLTNCNRGADLLGHMNRGQTETGGAWSDNQWHGGAVAFHTTHGVNIEFFDAQASDMLLQHVAFHDNACPALRLEGAQAVTLRECSWYDNLINVEITDDTDTSKRPLNITWDVYAEGCWMRTGRVRIADSARNIQFFRCDFSAVHFHLAAPQQPILLAECVEDSLVQVTGSLSQLFRTTAHHHGAVVGITTDATATVGWTRELESGEVLLVEAKVVGRQRNGTNYAIYHIAVGAQRPPASLAFDNQTANFTVGQIVVGTTTGARARIVGQTDSGAFGTLLLRDIDGVFASGEEITDGLGGQATVSGGLTLSNAALAGSVTAIRPAVETDDAWDATFGVSGGNLRVIVTGKAGHIVEWTAEVKITVP